MTSSIATPATIPLIRRADVGLGGEVMDMHLRVCERLRRDECARLSRRG